jgi:hypothetical protein
LALVGTRGASVVQHHTCLFTYYFASSPGRFFAVNEIKLMLAHVLLTYDVKLRDGMRPTDEWIFTVANANSEADVLFRRRVVGVRQSLDM